MDLGTERPVGTTGAADAATAVRGLARGQRRRRRWLIGAGAAAMGLTGFVLAWFQPQKLFIDERVDQAIPTAAPPEVTAPARSPDPGPDVPPATAPTPAEPVDLATGDFVSLDHGTSGTARVLELADGRRFVRLEGFETDNGPDLYVYLSGNTASGPEEAFDDRYADLGRLQGNLGDQNYEIPSDVDPADFASVVVWCDRFDSAFGAADLSPRLLRAR